MMRIGNRIFDTKNHTYIMGILNVTPDSFSDGGRFQALDAALYHAARMVDEGADILDVGGESTRPGHTQISEEEELARVLPMIEKLSCEFDVPISIDTYKSKVAQAALAAGASLVNDIWGLKYDAKMAEVIASAKGSVCLMHNRNNMDYHKSPYVVYPLASLRLNASNQTIHEDNGATIADYPVMSASDTHIDAEQLSRESFINVVQGEIQESIALAMKAGIEKDKIMLDPGVGFAKTYEMNLEVIRSLSCFTALDYPVLLGTSRKSVIGLALDLPKEEREEGTLATTVLACLAGCSFVRVHDVKKNKRAILMTEAIYGQN